LGCYGEVVPPDNAKGEIWLEVNGYISQFYFCY